ncbi:MAG TPA: DUF3040 domain-containing protein [Streptosporangiaceae bacterium]|nr:DUF3040 domain-containing protein [Streptosporangiaceae bacterium]
MALSMDEQRILDEIERRLADDDPRLAARLTAFGPTGLASTLRSRRGRILASFVGLVTLAVISMAAYVIFSISMRHPPKPHPGATSSQQKATAAAQQQAARKKDQYSCSQIGGQWSGGGCRTFLGP